MGFLAIAWAGTAPVADTYERIILYVLGDKADNDGTGAYESIATMAKSALCDSETVKRRLKAMQRRGVIARGDQTLTQNLRADRRPVVYDVLIPRSFYSDYQWREYVTEPRERRGQEPLDPASRPDITTPDQQGRAQRSDTGVPNPKRSPNAGALTDPPQTGALTESNGGSVRATNQSLNPSFEPVREPVPEHDAEAPTLDGMPEPAKGAEGTAPDGAGRFQEFYDLYPRKAGGRKKAEQSWNKALKDTDADTIINAAARFAESVRTAGTAKEYIPHVTTWLNQGRWTDELPATGQQGAGDPAAAQPGSSRGSVHRDLPERSAYTDPDRIPDAWKRKMAARKQREQDQQRQQGE